MWTPEKIEIGKQLLYAIEDGEAALVRSLCSKHPWLVTDYKWRGNGTWIGTAAAKGRMDVMSTLLDLGFNIDALELPEKSTALGMSIGFKHLDLALFLLSKGANPNLSRPLISALRFEPKESRMELIRALVDHGADVNRLYDLYGNKDNQFTVLDWAESQPEIAAYLREKGAKTSKELKSEVATPTTAESTSGNKPRSTSDEVVTHFVKNFGPVEKQSLIEVVPSGHPVAIHIIRPGGDRKHFTLFTTGLSAKAMSVPKGQDEYAFAEVFLQLPGDWDVLNFKDKKSIWPLLWLKKIAKYPHAEKTWLGGPLTIIANEEPPQPLGPGVKFTSVLLLAESSFIRSDHKTVQLYRAVPIYSDERELELREGAPALMRAFDRKNVPFVVDVDRPSVAKK